MIFPGPGLIKGEKQPLILYTVVAQTIFAVGAAHALDTPPKLLLMRSLLFLVSALVVLSFTPLQAQVGDPARADSATLQGQFDEMLRGIQPVSEVQSGPGALP